MDTKNIHHLTSAVQNTDIERSQLLNTLTSATRHIPPEILSEIFRLSACKITLREPEQRYYVSLKRLIKIGSVCIQWRRVAWGSSNLWTTCLLEPLLVKNTRFNLTSLALANCQANSNISVALELDDPSRYHQQLELLITQYQARLRVLRLYVSDLCSVNLWNQYFGEMSQNLPNLRELWIRWPAVLWRNCGHAFRSSTSDLEEIQSPSMMKCVPWRIPMDQLTVVQLFEFPIDRCVHLLLSCRNLVEFHCNNPSYPPSVYDAARLLPVPERPKSLHNIKRLRWRTPRWCPESSDDWIELLFSSIRYPNLERLFVDCQELFQTARSPLNDFFYFKFLPSVPQLRAVDMENFRPLHSNLSPMMTYFRSVEDLYFVPLADDSELVKWFRILEPIPSEAVMFPNLKTVHINVSAHCIVETEPFDAFCRFLARRREQDEDYVLLERIIIESFNEPQFTQDQKDILSEFVADGLALKWERTEVDRTLW